LDVKVCNNALYSDICSYILITIDNVHVSAPYLLLKPGVTGKEHIITYLSQCLVNAETRYSFIEKLCLFLFYACFKLGHYLLSSTCVVTCQADVIKHMLQQPILSGRIGKYTYALIEYNLLMNH
jgi:hypothetical protein